MFSYLDLGHGFTGVYVCQNGSNCTLAICQYIAYQLHVYKAVFKKAFLAHGCAFSIQGGANFIYASSVWLPHHGITARAGAEVAGLMSQQTSLLFLNLSCGRRR